MARGSSRIDMKMTGRPARTKAASRSMTSRAALARHLVATGHVEDEDLQVGKAAAEGRREVVAAAFDEDQVQRAEAVLEVLDRVQVGGDVISDGRMRAAAGADGGNALKIEHARPAQE